MEKLIYKRAKARPNVDLKLEHVTPLLKVSSEDTNNVTSRINNSFKNVDSHIKIFMEAREVYVEKIKEYSTGSKEEMKLTTDECKTFLRKVEVNDISEATKRKANSFKDIPKLKKDSQSGSRILPPSFFTLNYCKMEKDFQSSSRLLPLTFFTLRHDCLREAREINALKEGQQEEEASLS